MTAEKMSLNLAFVVSSEIALLVFSACYGALTGCGRLWGEAMLKGPSIRSHQARVDLSESRLLRLVERCYDAALNQAEWRTFLTDYSDAIGASSVNMHAHDLAQGAPHYFYPDKLGTPQYFYSKGVSEDYVRLYRTYYCSLDPWFPLALGFPAGTILYNEKLVDAKTYFASEFYNEFKKPRGMCHAMTISVANCSGRLIFSNAYRPPGKERFGDAEHRLARRLYPHLHRASRICATLRHVKREQRSIEDVLDAVPQAVLLLGEDGKVLRINEAASALIAEADGLDVKGGQLIATLPPATRVLSQLLSSALAWFDNPLDASGGVALVPRPSGRPSLSLFVSPLGKGLPVDGQQGRSIAVMVSDPTRKPAAIGERLAAAHGLTPAEARLAEGLVQGGTLADLAEQFGIAPATARVQLRSIFQKTDTNSQTELVRQVLLTLGSFPDGQR